MGWYFAFFFISGFCSILYELVWLRLSMAQFGVTTALVSIVLSMFMAGLGAGSWAAGKFVWRYGHRIRVSPLRLYGLAELLIAVSALSVPAELLWGHRLLGHIVEVGGMSSARFYLASGAWLAFTLIPWCACMGATIPLAMFAIQSDPRYEAERSFSFLYLANVLGAVAGTFIPLFLIELYGFHRTLRVGALLNTVIFVMTFAVAFRSARRNTAAASKTSEVSSGGPAHSKSILALLFLTGFVTMGMELVWIRLFTPYAGPIVYSFALILGSYLFATFAGSQIYRFWSRRHSQESKLAWISLAFLGLLSLAASDPRLDLNCADVRVFLGVGPFAGAIGFLTPMLVDRWSRGDPDRAGRAYAVNILGCIVGPLVSGFLLLPYLGERASMLFFAAPWFAMAVPQILTGDYRRARRAAAFGIAAISLAAFLFTQDFETKFPRRVVIRDSTATVTATGTGMEKLLFVNGVGMTRLSPNTKMMAHLTLASLDHQPKNALVICFGMGTTFRSALSWGIPVTVAELVPSVPKLFTYYHPDGAQVLASPLANVVIDDGRRYLDRSSKIYDAIVIDPPPPVETAGSSLLYSQDFYAVAKERLRPGGILQQWLPHGDEALHSSVARALKNSFPYVRVYSSVEGWGWHFLASTRPIPDRTAQELTARMPARAVVDMMEWGPAKTPDEQFERLFSKTMTLDQMIALSPQTPALQDDRPVNEYYLLRTPFDTWWCARRTAPSEWTSPPNP